MQPPPAKAPHSTQNPERGKKRFFKKKGQHDALIVPTASRRVCPSARKSADDRHSPTLAHSQFSKKKTKLRAAFFGASIDFVMSSFLGSGDREPRAKKARFTRREKKKKTDSESLKVVCREEGFANDVNIFFQSWASVRFVWTFCAPTCRSRRVT